jgi:hypothetical protein
MRIAVITPYQGESTDVLRRCHESVIAQAYPCTHVMVADGLPNDAVNSWSADHILLPRTHGDIGSTPRLLGAYHAIGLGFDAVAFLDADNWYRPDHIDTLVQLQKRTGAAFVCSSRELISLDGSSMGPCPLTNPAMFVDTSCMMFARDAYHLLHHWCLMPSYGHLIGDRIMLFHVLRSGLTTAFNPDCSVYYSCGKEGVYKHLGKPIPAGVRPPPDYESAFAQWVAEGNPPLLGPDWAQAREHRRDGFSRMHGVGRWVVGRWR